MKNLSASKAKSKTFPEAPPDIPLEADKIGPESVAVVSKDNQTNPPGSTATARPCGTLNGGSSSAFERVRAKRLQDAPAKFRRLYKRAWQKKSRKAAIRAFCLECMCWSPAEVAQCEAPSCPLYEYRSSG